MSGLCKSTSQGNCDIKEIQAAETVFVRDIENRVFQSMVLHCLKEIEGVCPIEGNLFDQLLGRSAEGIAGIHAEQSERNRSIHIKIEVNVVFGCGLPEKAEEIQTKVSETIARLTGLHVASVHVVFKNVISPQQLEKALQAHLKQLHTSSTNLKDEYADDL